MIVSKLSKFLMVLTAVFGTSTLASWGVDLYCKNKARKEVLASLTDSENKSENYEDGEDYV